ncbi:MAG: hypothetical protein ACN4GF_03320 [Lentimonas sp.]
MSRLYPLLLFIIASICFYAGYTVGFKKGQMPRPASSKAVSKPTEEPEVKAVVVEAPDEPVETPVIDEETKAMITDHEYSLRAAQKQITFTDSQDRKLVGEVVEANSQTLKVRRAADNAVVDLPIAMLCEADREFAAYLAKQSTAKPSTSKSMEDKIWDELFN